MYPKTYFFIINFPDLKKYTAKQISGYWRLSSLLLKLFYHEHNEHVESGLGGFLYVHLWEQSH